MYLPPQNSEYAITSPFKHIEKDIADKYNDGNILLLGDMNGRTASTTDYIISDKNDVRLNVDVGMHYTPNLLICINVDEVCNA